MTVHDLTRPVETGMPVYPGDPAVSVRPHATHAADGYRVSELCMGTHAGTHVDAPSHTEPEGASLGAVPVERFRGPALRVDCRHRGAGDAVRPADLPPARATADVDWLVVWTGWADRWGTDDYRRHPHLAPATARECARRELDVAVDALSVDPTPAADGSTGEGDGPDDGDGASEGSTDDGTAGAGTDRSDDENEDEEGDGVPAHHELLGAGRLVVENLANPGVPPDRFRFAAHPLAVDADGAPVRAVAVVD